MHVDSKLVEANTVVDTGAAVFKRVENPTFHILINLAAGASDHSASHLGDHLSPDAGGAELKPLEVLQGEHGLVKPAEQLGRAEATRSDSVNIESLAVVHLLPQLQPAALIHPGHHFPGAKASRVQVEQVSGNPYLTGVVVRTGESGI